SAWTLYIEVAQAATQAGQTERAALASSRVTALRDKLARVTIVVPKESRVPGLTIERGALAIGEAQWDVAMPVDAGTLNVKVSAPGKATWQSSVVAADGT